MVQNRNIFCIKRKRKEKIQLFGVITNLFQVYDDLLQMLNMKKICNDTKKIDFFFFFLFNICYIIKEWFFILIIFR